MNQERQLKMGVDGRMVNGINASVEEYGYCVD